MKQDLAALIERRIDSIRSVAKIRGCSPARCCMGYLTKHLASILAALDTERPDSFWDEKIGDAINYLILLEAIVKEKQ